MILKIKKVMAQTLHYQRHKQGGREDEIQKRNKKDHKLSSCSMYDGAINSTVSNTGWRRR